MDNKTLGDAAAGRSAEKYAEAAGVVMKAAPFAQAAAEQLPKIAPVVAPAAKKVADAAAEKLPAAVDDGVGKVAGAVKGAAGAAGGRGWCGCRSTRQGKGGHRPSRSGEGADACEKDPP